MPVYLAAARAAERARNDAFSKHRIAVMRVQFLMWEEMDCRAFNLHDKFFDNSNDLPSCVINLCAHSTPLSAQIEEWLLSLLHKSLCTFHSAICADSGVACA